MVRSRRAATRAPSAPGNSTAAVVSTGAEVTAPGKDPKLVRLEATFSLQGLVRDAPASTAHALRALEPSDLPITNSF